MGDVSPVEAPAANSPPLRGTQPHQLSSTVLRVLSVRAFTVWPEGDGHEVMEVTEL